MSNKDTDKRLSPLEELRACNTCPRKCNADRFSAKKGYCRAGTEFGISSICIHRGEEPVISGSKGICNVFFTNCNLQCVFCQNWQISDNMLDHRADFMELEDVLDQITDILDRGINILGFVSPGHYIPQMKIIVRELSAKGYDPAIVYNSNGYDDVGQLKSLEGMIDVYLPDFKYMESAISKEYSDARDYPEIALAAHKEMYRQMGSNLIVDNDGYAMRGMLIRHLVLPGHAQNSIKVLEAIATELSSEVHIALMSQYYPSHHAGEYSSLRNRVSMEEYKEVIQRMEELGIHRGFIQGIESSKHYRPDFDLEHPFE
ncbi:MAG: radical SAM protein [Bacteroidota bacterium]